MVTITSEFYLSTVLEIEWGCKNEFLRRAAASGQTIRVRETGPVHLR